MFVAGIDVGSITTEAVILDNRKEIVSYCIDYTGASISKACAGVFASALREGGVTVGDIEYCVSTGYARKKVEIADENVTEITCHSKGALHQFPGTRTIIDIGGQDSKIIRTNENGKVTNFAMNDKCAAGTGRFLEVMARALEIDLEEMGPMSQKSKKVLAVSSICTVFAESEVLNLLAAGHGREDIIAGIHLAIAKRVAALIGRKGFENDVTMTGGVAKNRGEVIAMEELIGAKINVPEEPQIMGALGAAIIALERNNGKNS